MINYKETQTSNTPLIGTVVAYGYTDYYEEEVFILDSNINYNREDEEVETANKPTVILINDHNQKIEPIEFIGEDVEFIPIKFMKNKNLIIGSFVDADKTSRASFLNKDKIVVDSAVITSLYEWGCFLLVNGEHAATLKNSDYFNSSKDNPKIYARCGKLLNIFSVGDKISNLEGTYNKNKRVFELKLINKVNLPSIENYPLQDVNTLEGENILECTVRDVLPKSCYIKVAPNVDALCTIPDHINIDRDLMPEDIVKASITKNGKGLRGKILDIIKYSNFSYDEMEGDSHAR